MTVNPMRSRSLLRPLAALALASLALGTGCAINPATGKRQFMLVSEAQEIEMGRQSDEAIVAQMGIYESPPLEQYIDEIGQRLAAESERPHLEWTFRLVDDPVVNAFALPGGYIYITRGILAHLDNEAELASVVGHEIGHVTARHGASQMSKAQAASGGLGALMVLGPEELQQFGSLLETGVGLLFLKFGRDDERQADDLGLRYLLLGGYDPRPMSAVFDTLDRVGASQGGERLPAWLSTHPAPENRSQRIREQIAQTGQTYAGHPTDRKEFLERIEGMTFGEDPRQGLFREALFLHPDLDFQLRFPDGWQLSNLRQAVLGKSPEENALITLSLARESTAPEALDAFFTDHRVARHPPEMRSIGGMPTSGAGFSVALEQGTLRGRVGYVEYGEMVYQLIGYSTEEAWPDQEPSIRGSLASFRRLEDRSVLDVQPRRLHVVRPRRSMSVEEFAREYDSTVPPATLALINRLDSGERLEAGEAYKVVTGGPD